MPETPTAFDPCPLCGRTEERPMFPTPQMGLPGLGDPLFPVGFYVGLGTGLVLAVLAVLAGLLASVLL